MQARRQPWWIRLTYCLQLLACVVLVAPVGAQEDGGTRSVFAYGAGNRALLSKRETGSGGCDKAP